MDFFINNNTAWRAEKEAYTTSIFWFLGVVPFLMLYTWGVVSFTGTDITNGLMYDWIDFTSPLADQMAKYFPVINNYTNQILANGDDWRGPRVRHLYALIGFVCIVISPLLFRDILRASNMAYKRIFPDDASLGNNIANIINLYLCLTVTVTIVIFGFDWGINGNMFGELRTYYDDNTQFHLRRSLEGVIPISIFALPTVISVVLKSHMRFTIKIFDKIK